MAPGGRSGPGPVEPVSPTRGRGRSRLRRRVPGSYLDASALLRRYKAALGTCRSAPAALPRPAPHVWHAGDPQGRHPPRPGVDGSRRRADHDALPALRASPRRRGGDRRGLLRRIKPRVLDATPQAPAPRKDPLFEIKLSASGPFRRLTGAGAGAQAGGVRVRRSCCGSSQRSWAWTGVWIYPRTGLRIPDPGFRGCSCPMHTGVGGLFGPRPRPLT